MTHTLEARFVAAVDELELPETNLLDGVLAQVKARPAPITQIGRRQYRRAVAAIAACLVAVCLAVTPVRDAVAGWFGIGATTVVVDPQLDADQLVEDVERGEGGGLDAGHDTSSDSQFSPIPSLGRPSLVLDHPEVQGRTFGWTAAPDFPPLAGSQLGVVLYVRPVAGIVESKQLPVEGPVVEPVDVRVPHSGSDVAVSGLWFDGPHQSIRAASPSPVFADRVLLWVNGGVQYRLEADRGLEPMLELAAEIEEGTELLPPG